jgi:novobiocin biosynthesis protein NovU/D-mycarose 3-C-methyltransferase
VSEGAAVRIHSCRVCGSGGLHPFLDLGPTALANSFLDPSQAGGPEPVYPLRAVFCPGCSLVQIDEEIPPEDLFRHYVYVSGTSDLVHRHARFLAEHFGNSLPLGPGDLVVEAASNDGTVLRRFREAGRRVLGVEPARNIAETAIEAGVPTVCEFFNEATARQIHRENGPARLVLARHVLAHVNDLHGFVRGMHYLLADDGLAAVEVPHLLPFSLRLEYDTIYHEHLCYFSVHVLRQLFARHGLEVIDVLEVPIHGGSIVVSAQRQGGPRRVSAAVASVLRREEQAGLREAEHWDVFARRVARSRELLLEELDRLRARGERLAGYGAPAKGMTLLAYCGIGPDRLPYLVDRSPHKQGLLTPGHHIPVCGPERLRRDRPDVVLLLAWNFADEVVRQQADYLRGGGRFLLPLPEPHYHRAPGALKAA